MICAALLVGLRFTALRTTRTDDFFLGLAVGLLCVISMSAAKR